MHRQHVTTEDIARETLTLAGPAAHHLLHVLRLREGDEVGAFDGAGATRLYHVAARTPEALTLVAKQPLFRQGERPVRLTLFACVPKGERMDWMLEKAVELGADRIVPVLSARTVVRLEGRQAAAKRERWLRVAEAAARQCGAARVPEVLAPTPFAETAPLMRACTASRSLSNCLSLKSKKRTRFVRASVFSDPISLSRARSALIFSSMAATRLATAANSS